jgi:hypothetical protein
VLNVRLHNYAVVGAPRRAGRNCARVVLAISILSASCTPRTTEIPETRPVSNLVFLTREGCVQTAVMRASLDDALRALGRPTTYQVIDAGTLPDSDARGGYGTPTVLLNGVDLFDMPVPPLPHPPPT